MLSSFLPSPFFVELFPAGFFLAEVFLAEVFLALTKMLTISVVCSQALGAKAKAASDRLYEAVRLAHCLQIAPKYSQGTL